jgi:hypothetical protein
VKTEDLSALKAHVRLSILSALRDGPLTRSGIAQRANLEITQIIRYARELIRERLVAVEKISKEKKLRYEEQHAMLREVLAGRKPPEALDAYADCTPPTLHLTAAGRKAIEAVNRYA